MWTSPWPHGLGRSATTPRPTAAALPASTWTRPRAAAGAAAWGVGAPARLREQVFDAVQEAAAFGPAFHKAGPLHLGRLGAAEVVGALLH